MITEKDLGQFTGTTVYHEGWCHVVWTDGVNYLAKNGMSWLCTDINSYWVEEKIRKVKFQVWTLKVNDDKSAVLTMKEDDGRPNIVEQKYASVDCPSQYSLGNNRITFAPSSIRNSFNSFKDVMKEGDRVQAWIYDEYTPIHGEKGTVQFIDDSGTVHIKFDNGTQLGAVKGVDRVELIE